MGKYEISQLRGAFMAGKQAAEDEADKTDVDFLGKYFHTFENGVIHKQGKVLSGNETDGFSVQWFSWLDGRATTIDILPLEKMKGFTFYKKRSEWVASGGELFQFA